MFNALLSTLSIIPSTIANSPQVRRSPIMSDKPQQPLPFVYQFAAGAVAGVSEVCASVFIDIARFYMSAWSHRVTPRKMPNN
jgi:hypothetical protein